MRPIDADAVIARVEKDIETAGAVLEGKAPYYVAAQAMYIAREVKGCLKEYLDTAPTLDHAPVVHGAIIESNENGKCKRVFSCCGTDFTQLTMWMIPNYCPNCGAKMDGGKKDG